jgi:(2Fe-2S) ferredoxin
MITGEEFRYASRVIGESTRGSTGPLQTGPACYVVACRGPNCRERGSVPFRKRLAELLRREPTVRLVGYACFGQCDFGPNVAFYPEGTWYGDLGAPDAAARVARHALGLERLDTPPLNLPELERGEHLQNIAELVRTLERDQRRRHHWWWPF